MMAQKSVAEALKISIHEVLKKIKIKRMRNMGLAGTMNPRRPLSTYLSLKCLWFGDLFFTDIKQIKKLHLLLLPGIVVFIRRIWQDLGFLCQVSLFFASSYSLTGDATVRQRTSAIHIFSLLGQIPEMLLMNQVL